VGGERRARAQQLKADQQVRELSKLNYIRVRETVATE